MTMTPTELATALDQLDGEALDQLGATLRERARHRRVLLTEDEARTAIENAPLTPAWSSSQLADVGRVRTATRLLVERGWHPEQVAVPMTTVAESVIGHNLIAAESVAYGLADGMVTREGDPRDL